VFERFSEKTNELEMLAEEEAEEFGHACVGPEHLLLGLLRQREGGAARLGRGGVTARALGRFGITLEGTRRRLASAAAPGGRMPDRQTWYDPRAEEVLRRSVQEAFDLGRSYVGPEHVLLALTREAGGALAAALPDGGAELGLLREELLRMVGRGPDAELRAPGAGASGRIVGLAVEARVGRTAKERARPRGLVADLDYSYDPGGAADPAAAVAEGVARSLARLVFKCLQEAADHAGQRALDACPWLRRVELILTDPGDEGSGSWSPRASAEAKFFR
jgi:hypothetical protein